ncbi:conjugal transfer protein TrbI, partial [Mesorhizobium sp. M1A.F.Ca.IN.022.05.2.1]
PYADQLKRGVSDGIIGEPAAAPVFQPTPPERTEPQVQVAPGLPDATRPESPAAELEPEAVWRARLEREAEEQYLRERHRQRMARLQANDSAYDSPIAVDVDKLRTATHSVPGASPAGAITARGGSAADLYGAALQAGLNGQNLDPNAQRPKEDFFNADLKELGYLPNQVVPQQSLYELKRGSVIPATLITGINSDLPGRITAQVSQNVYDSATGHRLLIPQGAKLFGRYDSKVSFGQSRVLVVWT